MAFNDVPLGDAGRNYYQQQFGSRVQNIRKYGAASASAKSGCMGTGGAAGGGLVALMVVVRIIIGIGVGVGESNYNSNYNYSPPTVNYDPPPQIDWNNDFKVDPPAIQDERPWANPDWQNPPVFPPVDPDRFKPDDPPQIPVIVPDDPPQIPDPLIPAPDDGPKDDK